MTSIGKYLIGMVAAAALVGSGGIAYSPLGTAKYEPCRITRPAAGVTQLCEPDNGGAHSISRSAGVSAAASVSPGGDIGVDVSGIGASANTGGGSEISAAVSTGGASGVTAGVETSGGGITAGVGTGGSSGNSAGASASSGGINVDIGSANIGTSTAGGSGGVSVDIGVLH